MSFSSLLSARWKEANSLLCVGLDPDPHRLTHHYSPDADGIEYFCIDIIDATADRMGLSRDKVMINIQKYGTTTAATIPLCLWDWEKQLKKGDNIILAAFGGGFTWGAVYVKWAYNTPA